MPITAAVIGDLRVLAVLAAHDMAAESYRAAALDRRHYLQLAETDMASIGFTPSWSMVAEDPHEREVPCHLGAVERHGEEETQRCTRAIDARRTHAGPRLMQLEKAKILRRGRIRRAAEKGCECPDVPDIVVARLLDEVAHRHVFDHASAQRADGLITHRGAPVLRWRLIDPSILKTERPPVTCARSKSYCGRRNRPTAPPAPPAEAGSFFGTFRSSRDFCEV